MLIELNNINSANPQKRLNQPIDFKLNDHEHIAIVGNNGSGKSIIAELIRGCVATNGGSAKYNFNNDRALYQNIATVTFRSEYDSPDFYYQQRWNSCEREMCKTVDDVLSTVAPNPWLASILKIDELRSQYIIELSSGELRRYTLFKTLAANPRVVIIDNLYVGLDVSMREQLDKLISQIASDGSISVISICARERDIPSCTTHVYHASELSLSDKEQYTPSSAEEESYNISASQSTTSSESVIEFNNINIRYGDRDLFRDFTWHINRGERWLLKGANGSGKTTLLSLINGDNPQAYAQKISLFGKKRGSGESIWDIKRRIGFLSPELLRGYMVDIEVVRIVASGLFDSVGLAETPSAEDLNSALELMKYLHIDHLSKRSFMRISSGEQRMVLAARAFIKNPEVLILDEPFHEVDITNAERISSMIKRYISDPNKTLIYVSHYSSEVDQLMTNVMDL